MGEANAPEEYEAPVLLSEDVVIFPHTEVTISTREAKNRAALLQASRERKLVVVIPANDREAAAGSIGTLVLIRETSVTGDGVTASVKGLWRVRAAKLFEGDSYPQVRFTKAEPLDDRSATKPKVVDAVLSQIGEFVKLIPGIPPEIIDNLMNADTPGKLADLCAYSPAFTSEERLELLRTLGAEERLEKIRKHFERQLSDLKEAAKAKAIPECETCAELADRVFESDPIQRGEVASEFLAHVVEKHTGELLGLLAEKYGPTFMKRRALR